VFGGRVFSRACCTYKTHTKQNHQQQQKHNSCDAITIAPALLAELQASTDPLPRRLSPDGAATDDAREDRMTKARFDALHETNQMAVDKLAEGIAGFVADQDKLEAQLAKLAAGGGSQ
jgi:transaldolase